MSKTKKIIIWVLSVLIIFVTIANIQIIFAIRHQNKTELKVVEYQHVNYELENFECSLSKQEIKIIMDALLDVSYKYYEIDDLGGDLRFLITGTANIKDKTIKVLSTISKECFITTLAHEIMHIKYKSHNDTFTEYKALTWLYETNINVFKVASLNRMKTIVRGDYAGTDYDCGYYILKYLAR